MNGLALHEQQKALVAGLAVAQKATDEQMKRTDEKLERIGVNLGNIGKNQGDVAEEFFFQSLIKDNHLGKIHFDDIVIYLTIKTNMESTICCRHWLMASLC